MSEVRTNSITDAAGTGAPDFPNGIEVSAGNVGIGTSSPAAKLDVQTSGGKFLVDAFGGLSTQIGTANGSGSVFRINGDARLDFYVDEAERMRIDSSGNVGIGTTAAADFKLDVNGGFTVGGTYNTATSTNGGGVNIGFDTTNGGKIESLNPGVSWYSLTIGGTDLIFTTGGVERLRLASTGAFGLAGANYGSSGQLLTSSGSGSTPSWATPVFTAQYVSSNQTITSAGLLTLAHSLGAVPKAILLELECATVEGGFSVGDDIIIGVNHSTAGDNRFTAVYVDATNVYVRYSNAANVFTYANKATGAALQLTNGSWRLRVRAFA